MIINDEARNNCNRTVNEIDWSGRYYACGHTSYEPEKGAVVYDTKTGKSREIIASKQQGKGFLRFQTENVNAVALGSVGGVAFADSKALWWNKGRSWKRLATFNIPGDGVPQLEFNPDAKKIAVVTPGKLAVLRVTGAQVTQSLGNFDGPKWAATGRKLGAYTTDGSQDATRTGIAVLEIPR